MSSTPPASSGRVFPLILRNSTFGSARSATAARDRIAPLDSIGYSGFLFTGCCRDWIVLLVIDLLVCGGKGMEEGGGEEERRRGGWCVCGSGRRREEGGGGVCGGGGGGEVVGVLTRLEQ